MKQHTSPVEQFEEFKHERARPPWHWPFAVHDEVAPPPRMPPPPGPPICTQHTWVAGSHVEPPHATPPLVDPEDPPLLDPEPPPDVDPDPPLLDPEPPLDVDPDSAARSPSPRSNPDSPLLDPEPPLDVDPDPLLLDSEPPLEVDVDPPPDPDPEASVLEPAVVDPVTSSSWVREPHPSARSAATIESFLMSAIVRPP